MTPAQLFAQISAKGSDKAAIAERVGADTSLLAVLLDGLRADAAAVRFGCEKVLRLVSEKHPEAVYPYFDRLVELLDSDNQILKWGAITALANLAHVDPAGRFRPVFGRYFRPISGPDLITAATVIKGAPKIARAYPALAERIGREVLKVEEAVYKTPECRRVAIGHALTALEEFFDLIQDKATVLRFVRRQLRCPRLSVARRARRFLLSAEKAGTGGD
jgi:hypothetical protein